MFGSIGDWLRLVKQAYKFLKPGGWLEIDEYPMEVFSDDDTLRETDGMRSFYKHLADAMSIAGKFIDVTKLTPLLHEAGFEHVHEKVLQLPIGSWPKDMKQKELGRFFMLQAESGFEAYGMALFTRVLGMDSEEAAKVVKGGLTECRDRKVHSYAKRYVYWAQKPVLD